MYSRQFIDLSQILAGQELHPGRGAFDAFEAGVGVVEGAHGVFVAALVGALLVVTVLAGFSSVELDLDDTVVGSAETTGATIFEKWVLPFEVLSVLLLAALIGAIILSRGEDRTAAVDGDDDAAAGAAGGAEVRTADDAPGGAR